MLLTRKNRICKETMQQVSFEMVANALLLISIKNEIPNRGIPSYWRLTKVVNIPPLEIGIDCNSGQLASITVFVDTSSIKRDKTVSIIPERGNVIVRTDIFTRENNFLDVNQAYEISLSENKMICTFTKEGDFYKSYKNGRVEIFTDYKNQIIGFSICDLTAEENKMLNSQ